MTKQIVEEETWEHAGFTCRLIGLSMGHRCGYVLIPPGHPWHGVDSTYDSPLEDVEVHGGVTWTGALKVDPQDEWWVGFDCAHLGDARDPALMSGEYRKIFAREGRSYGESIKDAAYVRKECESLAEQAAAAVATASLTKEASDA